MTFVATLSDLAEVAIARLGGPAIAPPLERCPLHDDGARKLRLAILMDAVHYTCARYRAASVDWINSESERWPFDFATIASLRRGGEPAASELLIIHAKRC